MTIILEKLAAFFAGPIGRWIVVAALVAAALFAGGVYERSVGYREGLDVGAKQLAEQAKANAAAVVALDTKYRNEEAAHKKDVDEIGARYETKLADAQRQRDADVVAARAGTLSLSIPSTCHADNGVVPGAGASGPASHAEARIELPREVTAGLYGIADDADEIVHQLDACQAIVEADRKLNPKGSP